MLGTEGFGSLYFFCFIGNYFEMSYYIKNSPRDILWWKYGCNLCTLLQVVNSIRQDFFSLRIENQIVSVLNLHYKENKSQHNGARYKISLLLL